MNRQVPYFYRQTDWFQSSPTADRTRPHTDKFFNSAPDMIGIRLVIASFKIRNHSFKRSGVGMAALTVCKSKMDRLLPGTKKKNLFDFLGKIFETCIHMHTIMSAYGL